MVFTVFVFTHFSCREFEQNCGIIHHIQCNASIEIEHRKLIDKSMNITQFTMVIGLSQGETKMKRIGCPSGKLLLEVTSLKV